MRERRRRGGLQWLARYFPAGAGALLAGAGVPGAGAAGAAVPGAGAVGAGVPAAGAAGAAPGAGAAGGASAPGAAGAAAGAGGGAGASAGFFGSSAFWPQPVRKKAVAIINAIVTLRVIIATLLSKSILL